MQMTALRKWLFCISLCLSSSTAVAQNSDSSNVEDSRAESFQAVKGPATDEVSGGRLLLTAYGTVWLLLMFYVLRIERLSRRMQIQLEQIEAELFKANQRPDGTHLPG